MRTTIDIPDEMYRQLKSRAALESKTVKELILQGVTVTLEMQQHPATKARRLKAPIVNSGRPGSLKIDNRKIYELVGFP